MRYYIRLFYKIASVLLLKIQSVACTLIFKFLLYLNNVWYGRGIVALESIPQLRISKDAGKITFGDNVAFNNYNNASWYSKCSIWVRENATLSIGNNTGLNGVLVYVESSIQIGNNVNVGGVLEYMTPIFIH